MKLAIIIRGIPGSGKKDLAKRFATLSASYAIHSPEDFFLPGIKYRIDASNRERLNEQCYDSFVKSLEDDVEIIIYCNTNAIHFRYERFVNVAKAHGYQCIVLHTAHPDTDTAVRKTNRDITIQEMQSMIDTFQP